MFDLVIRNGTIVDGSGMPGYRGDVGIRRGRLAAIGRRLDVTDTPILDASGKVVAPGFIDPHTHYDAQLCFDPFAFPAVEHGVTTVVTGNCSLSMAPVRPEHRDRFSRMFRLIEEMPEEAFALGVDWRWGDSFPSMVEALEPALALNMAPLVGHSVLRLYVMGDDARRRATDEEVAAMCDVLRECLQAGAVGLSTSFVDMDDELRPVPSRWAEQRELEALCGVLGEYGRMLQIVHEFFNDELTITRVQMLGELSRRYGIPTTLSPLFHSDAMGSAVERVLAAVDAEWESGARVWPQVQTRPIDISWTLAQRSLMFLVIPGWWEVLSMNSTADKLAAFADAATRERLVNGLELLASMPGSTLDAGSFVVRDVVLDRNRDMVGRTLGEIARQRGTSPAQLLVDLAVEEELGTWFIREDIGHRDPVAVGHMLAHPHVHIGASDGGAHVGSFATYGDTGFLFSRFVRSHPALTLEQAVKKITADTADIWGLHQRGRLMEGYAADVVVFDPATIDRGPEVASDDFPGAGTRWIRRSVGVDTTVVNGVVTWTARDAYRPEADAGVVASRP
jgi:N-acyl-D-aspartate/D-glutamate deacylase